VRYCDFHENVKERHKWEHAFERMVLGDLHDVRKPKFSVCIQKRTIKNNIICKTQ
jgi:hypothetical protein